jgi:hypothetical protein
VPVNGVVREGLPTLESSNKAEHIFANSITGQAITDCKKALIVTSNLGRLTSRPVLPLYFYRE